MTDTKKQYASPVSKLAAIMVTDIVGYTAIRGKDTKKALALVRHSKKIQKPLVKKYHGIWLKEMGDGIRVQFNTALDAVNCALEIQKICRTDFEAELRIGIHLGDITIENEDVNGEGVNIAARLQAIADPGGIYLSESIKMAIRSQSNVQAKYLGEIRLKNIIYGVGTYALQGEGLPIPQVKDSKDFSGRFWAELYRRGVLRAGATYLLIGILLVLVIPYGISLLSLPPWIFNVSIYFLLAGFPIALYLAWNYERSPKGFVSTSSRESWQNPYPEGRRKPFSLNFINTLLLLLIILLFLYPKYFTPPEPQKNGTLSKNKSVAILPLDDMSPQGDQQWLSDGVLGAILDHLSLIEDISVISKTTMLTYRGTQLTIPEIANELGVNYVLEGDIQLLEGTMRISVQLIDAVADSPLWVHRYDRPFEDIFILQSDITKKIADILQVKINSKTLGKIDRNPTKNAAAYALYLQAEDTFGKGSIELLDQAIALDPDYADAYALKALKWLGTFEGDTGSEDLQLVMSNAIPLLNKALATDPDNSLAHMTYGSLQMWYFRDFEKAEKEYLAAIRVDPSHTLLIGNYCDLLLATGRFQEALDWVQQAIDKGYITEYDLSLPLSYYYTGNFTEAKRSADRYIKNKDISSAIHIQIYLYLGRYEAVIHEYQRDNLYFGRKDIHTPPRILGCVAIAYDKLGQPDKTKDILKTLEARADQSPFGSPSFYSAMIYAQLGEVDSAFKWLDKGYKNHEIEMYWLKVEPPFAPIRSDPRYRKMLDKIGFPE